MVVIGHETIFWEPHGGRGLGSQDGQFLAVITAFSTHLRDRASATQREVLSHSAQRERCCWSTGFSRH